MADIISLYSVLAPDELRRGLQGGFATSDNQQNTLAYVCNDVTDTLEQYLDRQIVTRGPITSYFSPDQPEIELLFAEWPLISVTSVWETTSRTYDATTLLTPDVDYVVSGLAATGIPDAANGSIIRTPDASSQPICWQRGWRAVKAIYRAGYPTTAAVPLGLKVIARKLAVVTWREWERAHPEQDMVPGHMGGRFSAAFLTSDMKRDLGNYARQGHFLYEERVA